MDVFESDSYKEYFKILPLLIKDKTIKKIKRLKKSFSAVIVRPVKGYADIYCCHIDSEYSFVFRLNGQSYILLSVGKNSEDLI